MIESVYAGLCMTNRESQANLSIFSILRDVIFGLFIDMNID